MNKTGFITLHRQILDWEWSKNVNTFMLFVHLLLSANFEEGRFEGKVIKRGQLVTSLPHLSEQTGLTIQQVRTALQHLTSTGEITDNSNRRYRIITIVKYSEFQDITDKVTDKQQTNNRQITDNQQTDNRQSTDNQQQYNKNNKNNNGTKKQGNKGTSNKSLSRETATDDFLAFWDLYPKKVAKANAVREWTKLGPDEGLFQEIMTGLRKWVGSDEWTRDGGRFIPYPATWLHNRRWEDEVKVPGKIVTENPFLRMLREREEAKEE